MRLGILGDIHGYLPGSDVLGVDFAVHLTQTLQVDAFLQVGDMCHYRSFARPLYWIIGNNDWPDVVRQVESGERPLEHFHNLKPGEAVALTKGAESVRIAGLNGAYDPLYYDLDPAEPRPTESLAYFVREDVDKCLPLRQIDVFLAHGCRPAWATGASRTTACPPSGKSSTPCSRASCSAAMPTSTAKPAAVPAPSIPSTN